MENIDIPNAIIDFWPDRTPNRNCFLLFKVAPYKRIKALQRGLLYFNSIKYFADFDGEEELALRRDTYEDMYLKLKGFRKGVFDFRISLKTNDKEIILNREAEVTVHQPNPQNIMIYCMGAITDKDIHIETELHQGGIWIDKRFESFGDHMLLIRNANIFSHRINKAIRKNVFLYNNKFLEGGFGQVDYVDLMNLNGSIGLFRKDLEYSWQREYRLCLGAKNEALNEKGALELEIGDISDISQIIKTVEFIKSPLKFKAQTILSSELKK